MRKCYWLLNHKPTEKQKQEIETRFSASIVYPPQNLISTWSSLPLAEKLPDLLINSFEEWLNRMVEGDIAVIQGEMTITYHLVSELRKKGFSVYSSVTERVASEEINGETVTRTYIFRHVIFREYV
jgi:hypothetical protein